MNKDGPQVCSPLAEKNYNTNGSCFSKEALIKLALIWNKNNGSKYGSIKNIAAKTKEKLWAELNKKFQKSCNGSESCWVDTLGQEARGATEVAKSLRPLQPRQWKNKPYTWLSNYDIDAVMRQYQDVPEYKYKFLGVFPIDFEKKTELGSCISDEICKLNIALLYKKGIRSIGMITNLDRHDQPGSHWTSLFFQIDPNLKSYGAYYYDSTSTKYDKPPQEIANFVNNVKQQLMQLHGPNKNFRVDFNKIKHQYRNTECGVFSMVFQIRWLRKLAKNPDTVFEDVVGIKMNDNDIHQIRDVVYRKNKTKE